MFKIILPKIQFQIEKWKWNKEYRVYVSNLGNFKDEHKNIIPIRIYSRTGYVAIKTEYGYMYAHRLVMLTWKPIPNAENLTVDHLDHNKRRNAVDNLEWVSQKENLERAKKDIVIEPEDVEAQKNVTIIFKIGNKQPKIFCTLQEAIDFVFLSQGLAAQNNVPNKDRIKNKIINAIKTKTKYCNGYWSLK